MKIIVLIKQVPDTETKIKVKPGATDIDREGVNMVLNPYDEFAVEEAIKIKEKQGGEVIVITLGEAKAEEAVRTALAMGADRAIRLDAASYSVCDPYATAKALAEAVKGQAADLIICGKQAVDDDGTAIGVIVAELLGIPSASMVIKLEVADGKAKATREIEGGSQELELPLPCVITAHKGLNEPRYPSLPGIMKAKRKPLEVAAPAPAFAPLTSIAELTMPPERKAGQVFQGEAEEIVPKVVSLLRDEAKVI